MPTQESPRPKHRGERHEHRKRSHTRDPSNRRSRAKDSAYSSSQGLSADALASLNRQNDRTDTEPDTPKKPRATRDRRRETPQDDVERRAARQQRRRDAADEPFIETPPPRHHRRRRTEEEVFEKTTTRNHRRRDTGDGYRTADDAFVERAAPQRHRSRDPRDDVFREKDAIRGHRRRETEEDIYVEKATTRGHRKKNTEEIVLLDKSSPKRKKRDAEVDVLLDKDDGGRNQVKRRIVSGALLEEGNGKKLRGLRGGLGAFVSEKVYSDSSSSDKRYREGTKMAKKKKICEYFS